jgi:hypothetical protein
MSEYAPGCRKNSRRQKSEQKTTSTPPCVELTPSSAGTRFPQTGSTFEINVMQSPVAEQMPTTVTHAGGTPA